jgi:hypothetical protein
MSTPSCRNCGNPVPPRESNVGRPRVYCSFACRREWNRTLERKREQAERLELQEARRFAYEERLYGVREARRQAKWRAGNRGEF